MVSMLSGVIEIQSHGYTY